MLTVAELIRYRLQNERYVHRVAEAQLPTPLGEFRMIAYESEAGIGEAHGSEGESHVALVYGDLERAQRAGEPVLVRVHSHCLAGNLFGSSLCNCEATLQGSMRAIAEAGGGAIVYLHHTQRGLGVDATVRPPRLVFHRSEGRVSGERSEDGHQRVLRRVGLGGQILSDLGIHRIILLSNHPTHVPALQGFGIEIVGQAPIPGVPNEAGSALPRA
jgi:3,4-dihydroxy 2-butanone 4-phosphate synthase/GTP cyclohydrolase II